MVHRRTIAERLSGAMERRDEAPNIALAEEIAARKDKAAVAELVELVRSGTTRQRNDAMKVLYEIGARDPALIGGHCPVFLEALGSRTNRQVWGAMQALDSVAELRADEIAAELPNIIAAADRGSVIAKDRCTSLLTKLARSGYAEKAVPILVERLKTAAPNQFPTYAEQTASVVTQAEKPGLIETIRQRLNKITQRAKRERMEKLLRKLNG
ncbi:hypothetical protein GGR20_002177 [Devosia subaequoris]|uniref:HEAT repeat domain-containing protein n=1 Tax=Devosia subaequoris TaxID=395930 RepID=A0A7W6NC89_9HYPH|nr:hypothetical protein [Devosia subaequoris]MBB4052529.1 hypothetical protein [Devosia subaequoris]MCP1209687.1 hypothetical protein [Devosia subaequoris]